MSNAYAWTREQLDAAINVLRRHQRGAMAAALPEIESATGRRVTCDSLKHAFSHAELGPPSLYLRAGGVVAADDEPMPDTQPRPADTEAPIAQRPAIPPPAAPPAARAPKLASVEQLFRAVKGAPVGLSDLCDKLDLSPARARALIAEAQSSGVEIHLENDHVGCRPPTPADRVVDVQIPPVVGERQLVGVISDTHLGSKYCLRAQLRDFVLHAYSRGVREILHPGDILDGCYRHSVFEVSHTGIDAQIEDLIETLPRLPGLTYHAITGNHDHTFSERIGVNVGRVLEAAFARAGRDDLKTYGQRSAYLKIRGVKVHLWHPGGGGAYARSYKLQKRVENYSSGEKPAIMLAGHWHQYCHVYERGVHAIACPTFHGGGSEFSNMLGTSQAIGGLLLSWETTAHGTVRNFAVEPRLYFETEAVHQIDTAGDVAA